MSLKILQIPLTYKALRPSKRHPLPLPVPPDPTEFDMHTEFGIFLPPAIPKGTHKSLFPNFLSIFLNFYYLLFIKFMKYQIFKKEGDLSWNSSVFIFALFCFSQHFLHLKHEKDILRILPSSLQRLNSQRQSFMKRIIKGEEKISYRAVTYTPSGNTWLMKKGASFGKAVLLALL